MKVGWLRWLMLRTRRFAAIAIVALALVMMATHLLMPVVPQYRPQIQQWLSEALGYPVRIGQLKAEVVGWNLRLALTDVDLTDEQGNSLLHFAASNIELGPWSFIRFGTPYPERLQLQGARLGLQEQADGSWAVEGFSTDNEQKMDWRELVRVLASREYLELADTHLTITRNDGQSWQIERLSVAIGNDGHQHELRLASSLPGEFGQSLSLLARFEGAVDQPEQWHGRIYAHGLGLQWLPWLDDVWREGGSGRGGATEAQVWLDWANQRPTQAWFKLAGQPFSLRQGKQAMVAVTDWGVTGSWLPDTISGATSGSTLNARADSWQRSWQLKLSELKLQTSATEWPAQSVLLQANADDSYKLQLNYLRTEPVAAALLQLAANPPELAGYLNNMAIAADAKDIEVLISGVGSAAPQYLGSARFSDLALRAYNGIPGCKQASGRVSFHTEGGRLSLADNEVLGLEFPELFTQRLDLHSVTTELEWTLGETVLVNTGRLQAKGPGLDIDGRIDLQIPEQTATVLDIQFEIARAKLGGRHSIVPYTLLGQTDGAWLRQALRTGVASGGFVLRGAVDRFPFERGDGQFQMDVNVAKAKLRYHNDWPAISNLRAALQVRGPHWRFNRLKLTSMGLNWAGRARLQDWRAPRLRIDANAQAPIPEFLNASSLLPIDLGSLDFLRASELAGDGQLQLKLDLPLEQPEDVSVDGQLAVTGGYLRGQGWDRPVTSIAGQFEFDRQSVRADPVTGFYGSVPLHGQLGLNSQAQLAVQVNSSFDIKRDQQLLQSLFGKSVLSKLSGRTNWQMEIPLEGSIQRPLLSLNSDLVGVGIDLPSVLGKHTTRASYLQLDLHQSQAGVNQDDLYLDIIYGGEVRSKLILGRSGADWQLRRGTVQLGGADALLADRPGLQLQGQLASLDLASLGDGFGSGTGPELDPNPGSGFSNKGAAAGQNFGPLPKTDFDLSNTLLRRIDLRVGQLIVADGVELDNARLLAWQEPEHWQVELDAKQLRGRVRLPNVSTRSQPVRIDLDKLDIANPNHSQVGHPEVGAEFSAQASQRLARSIPDIDFACADCRVYGLPLGQTRFKLRRTAKGVVVESLSAHSDVVSLTGSGRWDFVSANPNSQLNIDMQSSNIGQILTELGYSQTLRAARSEASWQLHWAGSPLDFAIKELDGKLSVRLEDGELLTVDPGAGRVLGLFSFVTIPRRFLLDFSDLVNSGTVFDMATGNFLMVAGNAITDNLVITGPAADVHIAGRTGLATEDYDQQVTIYPHVQSSVSIAGAIVGGPAVGIGLLVAQELFKQPFQALSQIRYRIKGTWQEPQIDSAGGLITPAQEVTE